MLQPDLSLQVRLLGDSVKLPEAAATDRVDKIVRLAPGQPVIARILEQLSDGRYKVLLAGRSLSMQLPATTKPGQDIRLVYVGPEPRLTFALAHDQGSSATVSSGGRLAAALTAAGQKPAAPTATVPLFDSMPTQGNEIAPHLREALTLSGLFYESHQAQWVDGERPLNLLLREPQGKLSPLVVGDRNTVAPNGDAAKPAPPQAAQPATEFVIDGPATTAASAVPAHPESLPIIQQQLGALESGQILWQGQLWPGQFVDWKITEFSDEDHAGTDQEPGWETQINLALSALGSIDAKLRLQRGGVAILLQAGDTTAAALLQNHSAELLSAMNAAGLSVSEIRVSSHVAD